MKNVNLKIVLLILLSMTFGCRLLMKQAQTKFFEQDAAQQAANAVKSKVGFPFKVQEVEITPETFKMKIEAPGDARNIDEYTYIGFFVAGPQPVQRDAMTDSREKMPFDEIDFSVIPQIAKNALDKTQIEGGKVRRMTLGARDGRKFRWWIEIQGTRETASVWADLAGNVTSVDLSQTNRAAAYKILDEAELNKAADAIKGRFGEDALFEEIIIRETSMELKVLNSENPKMYDAYSFGVSGLKNSPLPSQRATMDGKPFALSSVDLSAAVNLAQRAKEKLALPDGKVSLIEISYETIFSDELTWTVSIKKGLKSGFVRYDDKFNEIAAKMD